MRAGAAIGAYEALLLEAAENGEHRRDGERSSLRPGGAALPHDDDARFFAQHPDETRAAVSERWGAPDRDPYVRDGAFRLPDRLKVRGGTGKWILRRWLDGVLPAARPFEKKRGFTVPVAAWGRKGPWAHLRRPGAQMMWAPDGFPRLDGVRVERLWRRNSPRAGLRIVASGPFLERNCRGAWPGSTPPRPYPV
mgnify:CR=1 FL=1